MSCDFALIASSEITAGDRARLVDSRAVCILRSQRGDLLLGCGSSIPESGGVSEGVGDW